MMMLIIIIIIIIRRSDLATNSPLSTTPIHASSGTQNTFHSAGDTGCPAEREAVVKIPPCC